MPCKFANVITWAAALLGAGQVSASDWTNSGGNPAHDGLSAERGPTSPTQLWSTPRGAIIAYQPLTEGDRVFVVRQTAFPPESTGSPVVCFDIHTGQQLWETHIPYETDDWTTWVGGALNGRVYASRGGNGASRSAPLYCLDAATGTKLWSSIEEINAGSYEGLIFAPNGDPVVCSFRTIWRFDHVDGRLVWQATRTGSVSGNCAGAIFGNAVYVVDAVFGGHVVVRYDLAAGTKQYSSPIMDGFTIQNGCFVGRDGTIYVSRTQNNPSVDHFYAFADSGTAMTLKWPRIPARWTTSAEYAVGPDGSVYMVAPGNFVARLDPDTGQTLDTSAPIDTENNLTVRMAADAAGRVYVSNGGFNAGRLYAFNADLTPVWDLPLPAINIGTPAIGRQGTLLVATTSDVRAYRTSSRRPGDLNCDGEVDFGDINPFVLALSDPDEYRRQYPDCDLLNGDVNGDGKVDFGDINPFVELLSGG